MCLITTESGQTKLGYGFLVIFAWVAQSVVQGGKTLLALDRYLFKVVFFQIQLIISDAK